MIVLNSVWGLGLVHDPVILEAHTQEIHGPSLILPRKPCLASLALWKEVSRPF